MAMWVSTVRLITSSAYPHTSRSSSRRLAARPPRWRSATSSAYSLGLRSTVCPSRRTRWLAKSTLTSPNPLSLASPDSAPSRLIHSRNSPAIVFVTAYDEHAVRAFEIQAFDYLLKPFDDDRAIATVKHAGEFLEWIRREGAESGEATLSGFGAVKVDFASHLVRRDGHTVDLRPKEYALLVALLKRGGRVASRLELLREVGGDAQGGMSRYVDTP